MRAHYGFGPIDDLALPQLELFMQWLLRHPGPTPLRGVL